MPITDREIRILLTGKDDASQAISSVMTKLRAFGLHAIGAGKVLQTFGRQIMRVGEAGLGFLDDAARSAIEFDHDMRVAFTQAQEGTITLGELKDAARDVASTVAVDLGGMGEAMFDLFSTLNLSGEESVQMLEKVAKAAVAGNTEIEEAMGSTIRAMSGMQLGFEDLDRVISAQFQAVRFGLGTYEEFGAALARVAPMALRFDVTLEDLSAMLSLGSRTLGGFNKAAIPVERTLELLGRPKTANALKEALDIETWDAEGKIRPIVDRLRDLNDALGDLTDKEKAEAIDEIFSKKGMVQASKFLMPLLENIEDFNFLIEESADSAGVFEDAYATMSESVKNKLIVLGNNFEIFKQKVGDAVVGALGAMADPLTDTIRAFGEMDDATFKMIAAVVALGFGFLFLFGALLLVLGSMAALIGIILITGGWFILIGVIVLAAGAALLFMWALLNLGTNFAGFMAWIKDTAIPRIEEFGVAFGRTADKLKDEGLVKSLGELKSAHEGLASALARTITLLLVLGSIFAILYHVVLGSAGVFLILAGVTVAGVGVVVVAIGRMAGAVLHIFAGMADSVAGFLEQLNKLPFVDIETQGLRDFADDVRGVADEIGEVASKTYDAGAAMTEFGASLVATNYSAVGSDIHAIGRRLSDLQEFMGDLGLNIETDEALRKIDDVWYKTDLYGTTLSAEPWEVIISAENEQFYAQYEAVRISIEMLTMGKYTAILRADGSTAIVEASSVAAGVTSSYVDGWYAASLTATDNATPTAQATAGSLEGLISNPEFLATLDAYGIPAEAIAGATRGSIESEFVQPEYMADLDGDPANAMAGAGVATGASEYFAQGVYEAALRVNNKQAMDAITDVRNALAGIRSKSITVSVTRSISNIEKTGQHGGHTGKGGPFLLHPDEFILSKAMREGRRPIPRTAFDSGADIGAEGGGGLNQEINIYGATDPDAILQKSFWYYKTRMRT